MDVPSTVSVIIGAVAVAVSLFALWLAWLAARESRENFQKTRDTLAEIDKRAAVIEAVVAENQRELLDTVKKLVIPEKSSEEETRLIWELITSVVQGLFVRNDGDHRQVTDAIAELADHEASQPQPDRSDAGGKDSGHRDGAAVKTEQP